MKNLSSLFSLVCFPAVAADVSFSQPGTHTSITTNVITQVLTNVSVATIGTLTVSTNFSFTGDVWEDTQVPATAFKTDATSPTLGSFGPSGNILAYRFQPNAVDDQVYFSIQMPHAWKTGSIVKPHIHVARTAAPGSASLTNVVFGLEYTWANFGDAFSAPTTVLLTNGVATANWTHEIYSFADISGSGKNISSVLVCRLYRAGTSVADTYDQDIVVTGFDLHYQKDGFGSSTATSK